MKTDRISRFIIDQVSLYDIEIKTEILILFLNSSIFYNSGKVWNKKK